MIQTAFPPKYLIELVNYLFPFISALAVGETISSQAVSCTVFSGTDPNAAAMVTGPATVVNGTSVQQGIQGGVAGVIYSLNCVITTSLGQALGCAGLLAVLPNEAT